MPGRSGSNSNGRPFGKPSSSHKGKKGDFSNLAKPGTVPVMKANRAEYGKVDTKGKWSNWTDGKESFKGK